MFLDVTCVFLENHLEVGSVVSTLLMSELSWARHERFRELYKGLLFVVLNHNGHGVPQFLLYLLSVLGFEAVDEVDSLGGAPEIHARQFLNDGVNELLNFRISVDDVIFAAVGHDMRVLLEITWAGDHGPLQFFVPIIDQELI